MLAATTGARDTEGALPAADEQAAAKLIENAMHTLYLEICRASSVSRGTPAGDSTGLTAAHSSEEYYEDLALSLRIMLSECGRALRVGCPALQGALARSAWLQGLNPRAVASELQYYPDLDAAFQQILQV